MDAHIFLAGLVAYLIVGFFTGLVAYWLDDSTTEFDEPHFVIGLIWPLGIPFMLGFAVYAHVKSLKIKRKRQNDL